MVVHHVADVHEAGGGGVQVAAQLVVAVVHALAEVGGDAHRLNQLGLDGPDYRAHGQAPLLIPGGVVVGGTRKQDRKKVCKTCSIVFD